jgi:hypothetical protein
VVWGIAAAVKLKRLRVEHLRGVTHVEPPRIGFEVRRTPE